MFKITIGGVFMKRREERVIDLMRVKSAISMQNKKSGAHESNKYNRRKKKMEDSNLKNERGNEIV